MSKLFPLVKTIDVPLLERAGWAATAQRLANLTIADGLWDGKTFPVDIDSIAAQLCVSVKNADLNEGLAETDWEYVSGLVAKEAGEVTGKVLIDNKIAEDEGRRRFSLAHETAHFYYWFKAQEPEAAIKDQLQEMRFINQHDLYLEEYFANSFAHYLLMPSEDFIKALQQGACSADLQMRYGVSANSVTRRHSYFDFDRQDVALPVRARGEDGVR